MKLLFFHIVAPPLFFILCMGGLPAFGQEHLAGDPFAWSANKANAEENTLTGDPFAKTQAPPERVLHTNKKEKPPWVALHKGWLESRNQFRLSDSRATSARQRLWLEGGGNLFLQKQDRKKSGEQLSSMRFFLSGSIDFDPAAADLSSDHDDFSADLHEAYCTFEGNHADFLVGKKMVRWGTGDGINPLDLINPLDHRDPLASGRSDNRLPVFLAQAIFALPAPAWIQELSLETVAVPLAKVNTLNGAGSTWEPVALRKLRNADTQGRLNFALQKKPENWFTDGKYALHLTATTNGWDFGLAGYSGVKNSPVFIGKKDRQGKVTITPQHPHVSAFGFTFAKGLNRSTLRGEFAVKPDYPLQKNTETLPDYTRKSIVEGVIGFDRTFSLNRYLNLQYFATFIPESEELTNRRWQHGITHECSDLFFRDDLKLGISGIVGFSGQGWTIQPYAEYRIGDNWLLAASVFLFAGDSDGSYGQFDKRDFVTLRLRWSF